MHTTSHYLALLFILLPLSGLLAVLIDWLARKLNRWNYRRLMRGLGDRYRDESWHTHQAGECLQTRTRR